MKGIFTSCLTSARTSITATPTFIKIAAVSILSLSLFFLVKRFPSYTYTSTTTARSQQHQYHLNFYPNITTFKNSTTPSPPPSWPPGPVFNPNITTIKNSTTPSPPPSRPPGPVVERTGIVDENGAMTDEFVVGEFDETLLQSVMNASEKEESDDKRKDSVRKIKIQKYKVCDMSMSEYIPCMDNLEAIKKLNSSDRGEKFERHCPERGKGLDCLVPRPKGYKLRIPWPKSRDEVWFDNVPLTQLVKDKGGQNWIARKKNKFVFPVGGILFKHGVDQYLDQISKMVPEIAFGKHTRVALDIDCGVANFGAYLMKRNVTTLSIAPKDVHQNQIQIALERGVPAMVAAFATRRLLYPSQAFELVHCSRCKINWTRDDGILLLEVNRVLRAGGYFVWAAEPVYKHKTNLVAQWKEMENLTRSLCWELVKKEGYIAIWQKPLNSTCYLSRIPGVKPSVCAEDDNPDNVWYVDLKKCISRLPENGYGTNITTWPERLHYPPDRLFSIKMDAIISRNEIYKAEWKYWNEIVKGYIAIFRWKESISKVRNVMDMRAVYGGFAAAIHDYQLDWWVMNVVPVSGSNTLPVIYDRGLIGVLHDWCEPFDTYPRTYDMLNAAGLFSAEQRRCDISTIMLEMDRILRPGGQVCIRETKPLVEEVEEIAKAIGWTTHMFDTAEGPHANWGLLFCEKRL